MSSPWKRSAPSPDSTPEPAPTESSATLFAVSGEEEVLIEAGIERARNVISVVASDANNLFMTVPARGLNPGLFILARADEEQTEKKLLRAGANRVVMPYIIGGRKMARIITKPAVTDFIEFALYNKDMGLEMGEIEVGDTLISLGKSVDLRRLAPVLSGE